LTQHSVPVHPKSRAATADNRYSPMLVGEVRRATTGLGVSWKLSGGSMWSSAVTNVSKNRQVRRAVYRKEAAVVAETRSSGASARGRLTHHAHAGADSQSTAKGRTNGQEAG